MGLPIANTSGLDHLYTKQFVQLSPSVGKLTNSHPFQNNSDLVWFSALFI